MLRNLMQPVPHFKAYTCTVYLVWQQILLAHACTCTVTMALVPVWLISLHTAAALRVEYTGGSCHPIGSYRAAR